MAISAVATLLLVILGGVSAEPKTFEEVLKEAKEEALALEAWEKCGNPEDKARLLRTLGEFGKLENKAGVLEACKVPIHFEVKKQVDGGKKNLELYYYEEGNRKLLAELLPLDLSAFIRHKLAKPDDKLEVHFAYSSAIVMAVIRLVSAGVHEQYNMWIQNAGGIGFVRLSEAIKIEIEDGRQVRTEISLVGSGDEKKLYYVRVPFHLFPQLDGEALQEKAGLGPLRGYTFDTCYYTKDFDAWSSMKAGSSCLVMNFGSGDRAKVLATPLDEDSHDEVHFITAKEFVMREKNPSSSAAADKELIIDSHLLYVVWVDLLPPQQFNQMEPKFVEKHGKLVRVQKKHPTKDSNGLWFKFYQMVARKPVREEVELVFEKDGKENPIAFPLRRCPEGKFPLSYCLRTDEAIGEKSDELGVTYAYELD